MKEAPVFRSVEQALHFSFLMEVEPATQQSQMQTLIDRMLEELGRAPQREQGTINFGGLTALEIRGQCAMVRGAVAHRLIQPEIDAVHARFGARATCQPAGVRGVRDYSLPLLFTQHDSATLAMAWSIYGAQRDREALPSRRIAAEYGLAKSTVIADTGRMRRMARMLEGRAIERLTPSFVADGLVAAEDDE